MIRNIGKHSGRIPNVAKILGWTFFASAAFALVVVFLVIQLYQLYWQESRVPFEYHYSGTNMKPSSTRKFLDDSYEQGVEKLMIPASDAKLLGADPDRTYVAVQANRSEGMRGDASPTLEVYNTKTFEKTFEVEVFNCASITDQGVVYCSSEEDSIIRGYDLRKGEIVASFPIAGSRAAISWLGSMNGQDVFRVERYSETQQSFHSLVGVKDQHVEWATDLPDQMKCTLVADNTNAMCLVELKAEELASDPQWSGTNTVLVSDIRIISTKDGTTSLTRRTGGSVTPLTDGWVEYYFLTQEDYKNSNQYAVYDLSGDVIETLDELSFNPIEPMLGSEGGNTIGSITYPRAAHTAIKPPMSVVVNANGEVVYELAFQNKGGQKFVRPGELEPVFDTYKFGAVTTVSKTGKLVLFSTTHRESPGYFKLELLNTEFGTSMGTGDLFVSDYNIESGIFAAKVEETDQGGVESLVVFLPKK
ncbi:hypothetical protein [Corynebacterium freiburgense]|uniref:hypothetical protein n=1 Tax=Corynebacterium freiburgense TaxID=556548 RepID=UPI00040E7CD6|nr:hypothetical protein [Corynebacterium freiburgense]WJZ02466.1 hypothetical protein CFREI_05865 [Corynebacterium freiburgense]